LFLFGEVSLERKCLLATTNSEKSAEAIVAMKVMRVIGAKGRMS